MITVSRTQADTPIAAQPTPTPKIAFLLTPNHVRSPVMHQRPAASISWPTKMILCLVVSLSFKVSASCKAFSSYSSLGAK